MRRRSVILALLLNASTQAQSPTLDWTETIPNVTTPGDYPSVGSADGSSDGTLYISGGSNGAFNIVGDTLVGQHYVARFDTSGTLLWARTALTGKVAAAGSDGVYVASKFTGTLNFGGTTLTATGSDAIIARLDVNGQPLWIRQMGGAGSDGATDIAVDGLGRVHVSGYFQGTAAFGATNLIATHDSTGFLATLDANGNFLWAARVGGVSNPLPWQSKAVAIACDATGNTYAAGVFDGTGTFGSLNLTALQADDVFLARFDASGTCTWVQQMGGDANAVTGLGLNSGSGIYLCGMYTSATATFGSTTLPNANTGNTDIFLTYCDASGAPQWAQRLAVNTLGETASSLSVDAAGNAWICGDQLATSDYGSITLVGSGMFLTEVDQTGAFLQAARLTSAYVATHTLGPEGGHYVFGQFFTDWFDATDSTLVGGLTPAYEGYLARYHESISFQWLARCGVHRATYDGMSDIAVDDLGNSYVGGHLSTSAIVCDDTLVVGIDKVALIVGERDPSGACVWTRLIRTTQPFGLNTEARITGIARAANGDVVIAGHFQGMLDFGGASLQTQDGKDLFVARYDMNGNLLWAHSEGSSGNQEATSVEVDAAGNVIVVGTFTDAFTIGGTTLTSAGLSDGFIAKYNPAGTSLWAQAFGGTSWDAAGRVACDAAGNIHVTGQYTTACSFGPITVNGTSDRDLFVAKYNGAGTPQWALGSTGSAWKEGVDVAVAASGQVIFCGWHTGITTVGGSTLTGDPSSNYAVVGSINSNGSLQWLKQFTSTLGSTGGSLSIRPGGELVLAGTFSTDINLDGTVVAGGIGVMDLFIAGLEPTGDVVWSQTAIATNALDVVGGAVAADAQHVFVAGGFGTYSFDPSFPVPGTVTFMPGDPSSLRSAPNALDGFIAKYTIPQSVGIASPDMGFALALFPNPVEDLLTIASPMPTDGNAPIVVRDLSGREVKVTTERSGRMINVDAAGLADGVYSITLHTAQGTGTTRFVKR
ncbi:MAG: T9SS type A sorting domain-containing protein [Flavobacteriales bacterium]|jgi:hypothetical protein|nr:T9SS type A sorting domain-containing protein [Flavobacteriales bacterium]